MASSYFTLTLLTGLLLLLIFALYRAILPKPIPGIPYDRKAASRIFGDVPDALKYHARTEELMKFLAQRCKELGSPVIQVFMRPFARPWVILCDGREAQDIMTKRGHELDRSDFFGDLFATILPNNQVIMRTNDHWRSNRRLVADTMSPSFLNSVASRAIYTNAMDLVSLWTEKARLAGDHTIEVWTDMQMCTVDTIWQVAFGAPINACKSQADFLKTQSRCDLPGNDGSMAQFPSTPLPDSYGALSLLAKSSEIPMNSPLGRTAHWLTMKFVARYRAALALRDQLIDENINLATRRHLENDANGVKSAIDHVIHRESAQAKKENRKPMFDSEDVRSELAGFLNAGFETTSSTMSWGLKYLTADPSVHKRLKDELKGAFEEEFAAGKPLEAEAIAKSSLPYLDAFMDKVLRHSSIVPVNVRVATQDTQILGHLIPKGTDVFMMTDANGDYNCGPSFIEPSMEVEEGRRNASSQDATKEYAKYQLNDLDKFRPERWLKTSGNGEVQFDPRAAPMQSFGLGLRGCFGKRLAYLEMRMIYVLLLWHFDFQPIPSTLLDFKAKDVLTHQPQNVRIMLKCAE